MTRIVTSTYRYKRPPKKRKAVALEVPAVVRRDQKREEVSKPAIHPASADDDRKRAIVISRRRGKRFAGVPDMTPEEYQRRGEAADALWRELVRRATAKDRP